MLRRSPGLNFPTQHFDNRCRLRIFGWHALFTILYTFSESLINMFLQNLISQRIDNNKPVKVALIGAGKFGSMFLSQVPTTPGLEVVIIADLIPDNAKKACKNVGWNDDLISNTEFVDSGIRAITKSEVEVVVEATGHPSAGILHAREAFRYGKHIVMVNVEADV